MRAGRAGRETNKGKMGTGVPDHGRETVDGAEMGVGAKRGRRGWEMQGRVR